MDGSTKAMAADSPQNSLSTGRPLKLAILLAVVLHLAFLLAEISRPENEPAPVIEITLDAPQDEHTRDAGEQLDPNAQHMPTQTRIAAEAGADASSDTTLDQGQGLQQKGAWAASDANRAIPTQDRIDQLYEQVNAALRTGYVTSRTLGGPEGRYLAEWKRQVEVYGNHHYPQALVQQNISGQIILEVTVGKRGQVLNLAIRRSSGNATLDNAARNLLQAAAPYPAFPAELAESRDRLVITRTWVFTSERQLRNEMPETGASP
ncbi:TonB family protein [Guyparkeria sp. 1SP6A2]|nr:TonB family protein [Guyparkeria sp. 1SP6A2]